MTRNEQIIAMRAEGLGLAAIAEQVGLSRGGVWRILRGSSTTTTRSKSSKRHRCATPGCDRHLTAEHSIYSTHTGARYCWPGEGCMRWSPEKRRRMREAHERATP